MVYHITVPLKNSQFALHALIEALDTTSHISLPLGFLNYHSHEFMQDPNNKKNFTFVSLNKFKQAKFLNASRHDLDQIFVIQQKCKNDLEN